MGITNFRVDGFVLGLAIKAPCHTVSTINVVTLSGVGANIGGYIVSEFDRVLLTAQTNPIDNGIYSVRGSAWLRDGDADGNRDWVGGTIVPVWTQSLTTIVLWRLGGDPDAKTIGVDALTFTVYFDPSASGEVDTLQSVTDRGKTTDTGIDLTLGGLMTMEDSGQTQLLTISQTLNPAVLDTTGAGINFTGATVEYTFSNNIRIAGNVTAQNNGILLSLNGSGTQSMSMVHDDAQGVLESSFGPVELRVNTNGSLRANEQNGTAGDGQISAAQVKDKSDSYVEVGLAVMRRINVGGGASTQDDGCWHRKLVTTSAAQLTFDSADHEDIDDDAVFWAIANVGDLTLVEGTSMTIRKFLGGGASVTGDAVISEGGWVTVTKHSDTELWVVGLDFA